MYQTCMAIGIQPDFGSAAPEPGCRFLYEFQAKGRLSIAAPDELAEFFDAAMNSNSRL